MNHLKHDYRQYQEYTPEKWREVLWHLYSQKLAIVNLLGDREMERGLLRALDVLEQDFPSRDNKIELLMLEVRHLSDRGDLNLAEEKIDGLFKMLDGRQEREILRQAYEWRALVAREKTRTKEALGYYDQAEQYADNELSLAGIWLDKGLALVYDNQLVEAEKMLGRAIGVYRHFNSTDMLGDACNNLGICLVNQERVADALAAYLEASNCYDRIGYKLGSAIVSGNVSQIYWYQGDYDSAFRLAEKCRRLGTEAEDQISIALSYEMKGRFLLDLGSYSRAFDSLAQALRQVEEVGDRVMEILERLYQAQCCSRMGDCAKAENLLEQCREMGRELKDPEIDRRLQQSQIEINSQYQEPGKVLEAICNALDNKKDDIRQHDLSRLLYIRARLLLQIGDKRAAAGSFTQLMESLSGTEYQSFLACVHALGAALARESDIRPAGEGHREKARQIVCQICQRISDPELRVSFISRPEFKALNLTIR
jgi:tetratricopeptide (TPR) repeat protein